MPQQESHIKVQHLRDTLEEGYNRLSRKSTLSPVIYSLAFFMGMLSFLLLLESFQYFTALTKSVALVSSIVVSIALLYKLRKPGSYSDFRDFYRRFCSFANLRELNYSIDLLSSDNTSSPALVKAAIDSNLAQVDEELFKSKLNEFLNSQSGNINYTRSIIASSSNLVVLIILGFIFSTGTTRLAYFWKSFNAPNPYSYTVYPGDTTYEQGSPFSAQAIFSDRDKPKVVVLRIKTEVEEEFRSISMVFADTSFQSIPININNDMEYYIEMDGFKSPTYIANVQLRPRFSSLKAQIIPPAYTKLDSTIQAYPFSQLEALQGSVVRFDALSNKEIVKADIIINNERQQLTKKDSLGYSIELKVAKTDTLYFELEDENALTNKNPFQIVITPITDKYPSIEILQPNGSFEMVEPKLLDITYKAVDDFDLRSARLRYEVFKAYVEKPTKGSISLNKSKNGVLQNYNWDLKDLKLAPLDRMGFWIEVTDNDAYNGFKTSQSQVITLTVPSLIDYFESLNEDESDIDTSLESISESFEEMEKKYKEFRESLKENPETKYEQHKQLDEVQKQQQEVEKQIEELNKKFEEIKKELNENELLSEETRKAYEDLKNLMEEINDPELQEALKKLQEQMSRLTPEQLRQAMEKVEFNEQAYKERLNRTIELFKQLKLMSDLEKLAKSFEDKARQEEEIKNNPPDENELAKKRDEDQNQLDKLQKALDKLIDYTSKKNEKQIEEFKEETKQDLDEVIEKLKQQLEENSQSDGEKSNESPKGKSETFEQDFKKMAQRTRKAMEGASMQQLNMNIAGLRHVLYSLLTISKEQEDLVVSTQETENSSIAFVDYARNQKNVQQIFNVIADSLTQIAAEVPQFSNEIAKRKLEVKAQLERSLEQMAERNTRNSSVASRQVFGGINEIAFMIANLLEQLQDQSSGSGGGGGMSMQQMMEQLGEMGKDQQQLNQQIQDMINDMQGERLSQDQMERIDQIARQQNQIRKQLQEMQRSGGTDGDKIGSELQRMIEEMEDVINDLRGGAVDPTLVQRQQNILSRMLESEKALQERDEEEKREGKTGTTIQRAIPPELTLEELEKQIRTRLNDPNFTKYSPDYQRLIERYFELLYKIESSEVM
ncbi:MAG: DUF4175 family protein [Balneolaceae bacterium]